MASLLKNNAIIVLLVLVAGFFAIRNIAKPLLTTDDDFTDAEIVVDEPADLFGPSEGAASNPDQALQFASAQYDIGHFSATDLRWNEQPARDPFAPRSAIEAGDVNAVLRKVKSLPKTFKRSALALPTLSAVVNSASYRYAIINDNILTVGDRIAGFQVESMGRASVSLRQLSSNQVFNVVVK